MKKLLTFAGGAIAKAIPLVGIGSEIKENLINEIKAAAICMFLFGFSSCIALTGLILLVVIPNAPGYGIGLLLLAGGITWPSWIRLQTARARIDAIRPLIESAQRVSQMASGALSTVATHADTVITAVSDKAGIAVNAAKGLIDKFTKK